MLEPFPIDQGQMKWRTELEPLHMMPVSHLRRQGAVRNGHCFSKIDRTCGHDTYLPAIEGCHGIWAASMVQHRRRAVQRNSNPSMADGLHLAGGRPGIAKSRHDEAVRADLRI